MEADIDCETYRGLEKRERVREKFSFEAVPSLANFFIAQHIRGETEGSPKSQRSFLRIAVVRSFCHVVNGFLALSKVK